MQKHWPSLGGLAALLLMLVLMLHTPSIHAQVATEEDFPQLGLAVSEDGRYRVSARSVFDPFPEATSSRVILSDVNANTSTNIIQESLPFANGPFSSAHISRDGNIVVYFGFVNDIKHLFRYDRRTDETFQIPAGDQSLPNAVNQRQSADGRYTVYQRFPSRDVWSIAGNKIYLSDFANQTHIAIDESLCSVSSHYPVSHSNAFPTITSDGRFIAYNQSCVGGVSGTTVVDVYVVVYDTINGTNERVAQGQNDSTFPRFSADGRFIRYRLRQGLDEAQETWIYDRITGETYEFGLSNECLDFDGDGWGYNDHAGVSCRIDTTSQGSCDYSNADIFDGWGWNAATGQSCEPLNTEPADAASPTVPLADGCDYTDATQNDGWGWNATTMQSCAPTDNIDSNSVGACDYRSAQLNNGWGWDPVENVSCPPL